MDRLAVDLGSLVILPRHPLGSPPPGKAGVFSALDLLPSLVIRDVDSDKDLPRIVVKLERDDVPHVFKLVHDAENTFGPPIGLLADVLRPGDQMRFGSLVVEQKPGPVGFPRVRNARNETLFSVRVLDREKDFVDLLHVDSSSGRIRHRSFGWAGPYMWPDWNGWSMGITPCSEFLVQIGQASSATHFFPVTPAALK